MDADLIERKIVHDKQGWKITVDVVSDMDATPYDADCYSEANKQAWRNDAWRYVGLVVHVALHGNIIATDSLWAVEYGDLGEGTVADVWELLPAQYDTTGDGTPVVGGGSPLSETIVTALGEANEWLTKIVDQATSDGWVAALATFDPNRKDDQG